MALRIEYLEKDPASVKPLYAMAGKVASGTLEPTLRDLVEVRISQINGCSNCVDIHIAKALRNGERQQRLDLLPYWRDLDHYSPREKAALGWAESLTLVRETHVPDQEFRSVSEHLDEQEVIDLTMLTVLMNSWNRISIAFRHLPAER